MTRSASVSLRSRNSFEVGAREWALLGTARCFSTLKRKDIPSGRNVGTACLKLGLRHRNQLSPTLFDIIPDVEEGRKKASDGERVEIVIGPLGERGTGGRTVLSPV